VKSFGTQINFTTGLIGKNHLDHLMTL
jgi:hypothetical protein